MQKITPNLWCNGNAEEMIEFYGQAFSEFEVLQTEYYPQTKEDGLEDFQLELAGKVLTMQFRVHDLEFVAINAGPEFTPNPSISFFVNFDPASDEQAREHLDELWAKLVEGGTVLMELGEHPFSKHYGWVQDKFGVSWQLILTNPEGEPRPKIIPSLLFSGPAQNRAREAAEYYVQTFMDAKLGNLAPYGQTLGPVVPESLAFGELSIAGEWLTVIDSGVEQPFTFSEGISLSVACKDQAEIDTLWEALSTVPEAEQCGWCKDQFGVSWQIVPENMSELMQKPEAYKTMMQQKKIQISDY